MKVLLIEDQEKLCKLLKASFEKEGNALDYVLDGEAGERRIELYHNNYDLIILDLMLPKKTGEEVCRDVRKMGITVPVLVLTAKSGLDDKINLLNMGADDYLAKPFSFEELLARVKAILRRPRKALPQKLQVNGLTLDPVSRKVYKNGKEITLTLKEFALLEYLMRSPGQAIKREELIDSLWDFNFSSFSNIVDVHVNNLRKKVNGAKHEKLIETVRGVGYRINSA